MKLKEKKLIFKLVIQIKMKTVKNSENKSKGKTEVSKSETGESTIKRICGIIGGIKRANSWIKYNEYKSYSVTSRSAKK